MYIDPLCIYSQLDHWIQAQLNKTAFTTNYHDINSWSYTLNIAENKLSTSSTYIHGRNQGVGNNTSHVHVQVDYSAAKHYDEALTGTNAHPLII